MDAEIFEYDQGFAKRASEWLTKQGAGGSQPSGAGVGQHDPVNSPKHYTSHPSGVECIQITRHMSFNIGNVVKYVWRADEKGAPIEDLEKAAWYLQDEINRRKANGK